MLDGRWYTANFFSHPLPGLLPQVLPLLTVYLYFTTSVCRDLQRTVSGRILRVRLLTELGLHSEAAVTLQQLLRGDRLPNASDSASCWLGEGRTPRLDPALPLLDPSNLKVLVPHFMRSNLLNDSCRSLFRLWTLYWTNDSPPIWGLSTALT